MSAPIPKMMAITAGAIELTELEGLRRAAEIGLPVLALGGVTNSEQVCACVAAGRLGYRGDTALR